MTLRRPNPSDIKPSGHCDIAPPITAEVMNQAASVVSVEMLAVNTGASDQKAPLASPTARQPMLPAGDI